MPTDPNQPASVVPGKPILSSYPTPNLSDRIFVVHKDSRLADYKVPTPGSKPDVFDPENRLKDFVFATARPSDQIGFVDHFYVNERLNQDAYNYSIEYPWVATDYPRIIRTYVDLRSKFAPPTQADVDPVNSALALVEMKVTRSDDPVIDSIFIAVQKVFERLPAPTEFTLAREDAELPYGMRTLVPAITTQEFQEGPAVAANAAIVVNEEDWHVEAHTISAFKRMIMRVKRILPEGGAILTRSRKLTNDQQLGVITQSWKIGNQTLTPSALLIEGSIDDLGNNTTLMEELVVDEVFPAEELSAEIRDVMPPEFENIVPLRKEALTIEGQAEMPILEAGELSKSEQQQTEFKKRVSRTYRDSTDLPAVIVDQETSEAFGFGGMMDVTKTLAAVPLEADEGIGVVESSSQKLAKGLYLRKTTALEESQPALRLTAGGSGYTAAPLVSFSGGSGDTATGEASISTVVPPSFPTNSITLHHAYNGDANGVFYFLGKLGRAAWVNPHTSGEITITTPYNTLEFGTLAQIVDRQPSNVYTNKALVTAYVFDLGTGRTLLLKKMSFRARTDYGSPTNTFNIQGSNTNNGSDWVDLESFDVKNEQDKWTTRKAYSDNDIENIPYRYFRLLQPTNVSNYFAIGELELYGTLSYSGANVGISGGVVTGVDITDPGQYSVPPSVTFSAPPSGTTATGVAVLDGSGGVIGVTITNHGNGYTTAPTVTFGSGDADSAAAVSTLGFAVASIAVDDGGSNYQWAPAVRIRGQYGGGAGASAVLAHGVGSIEMLTGGSGYSSPPDVTIAGDATGDAVLGFGIQSIAVDDPGTYDEPPDITFDGDGTGAAATALIAKSIADIDVTSSGSGYDDSLSCYIDGPEGDGGADIEPVLGFILDHVTVTNGGSGYTSAPNVVFSHPTGEETHPVANSTLGYGIASIAVTDGGSGYVTPPDVVIMGTGTGAAATAVLTGDVVTSVTIDDPGEGYTGTPTVVFSAGPTTTATGTVTKESTGSVKAITITNVGHGLRTAPTVSFTGGGGGTGAAATAYLNEDSGEVQEITINDAGSGFIATPLVVFEDGGDGSGAVCEVTLSESGSISSIVVTAAGKNYTAVPDVIFSDGAAAATATLKTVGSVARVDITDPGTDYTTAPVVSFSTGSATARAILSSLGYVVAVNVINGGKDFRSAPTIEFVGGGTGSGAAATATLATSGSVVALTLTDAGYYATAPTVIFTPVASGPGSGAHALYILGDSSPWPTLYETETDPTTGIVIEMVKDIVPAGTRHPGDGSFTDIKPLDKWRSIQIVSKVDINSLPPTEVFASSSNYNFPPVLESVSAAWAKTRDARAESSPGNAEAVATSTLVGALIVKLRAGSISPRKSETTRMYFVGPPTGYKIDEPEIIEPSHGTAILFAGSTTHGAGTGGRTMDENTYKHTVDTREIGPCLTGDYLVIGSGESGPTATAVAFSDVGVSVSATSDPGRIVVDIPRSTPSEIQANHNYIIDVRTVQWRFGLWVTEITRVFT